MNITMLKALLKLLEEALLVSPGIVTVVDRVGFNLSTLCIGRLTHDPCRRTHYH